MKLLRLLYDLLWCPVVLGWLVVRLFWRTPPGWQPVKDRLGLVPPRPRAAPVAVWVHAVSIGELLSARPVLAALRRRHPAWWLLLSTSHPQAYALGLAEPSGADAVCLVPWDFRPCVTTALKRARPDVLVLVECELWPNLILEAARNNTRVLMLNARIYERDLPRYLLARRLFAHLLRSMSFIAAQSGADHARFLRLGAPPESVEEAGNTKFDVAASSQQPQQLAALRRLLPLRAGPLWMLASTHPGEEELILSHLGPLGQRFPLLQLVIAPRHIGRGPEVSRLAQRLGLRAVLRSTLPGGAGESRAATGPDVIVLDTVGELAVVLALADLVFVGGSLVPRGGHNPIEAARHGRAILTGPSQYNFADVLKAFVASDAVQVVANATELAVLAGELLADPGRRNELGQRAAAVVQRQAGTAGRFVLRLERLLGSRGMGLWPTERPA